MCRPMAHPQVKAPNWTLSCKKWDRWESKKAFHSHTGSGKWGKEAWRNTVWGGTDQEAHLRTVQATCPWPGPTCPLGPGPKTVSLRQGKWCQIGLTSPALTEVRVNCECHRNRTLQQRSRGRMTARPLMNTGRTRAELSATLCMGFSHPEASIPISRALLHTFVVVWLGKLTFH